MKRYEETLHQFQKDLERAQDNHRNSTLQVHDISSHSSSVVSRTIANQSNAFRFLQIGNLEKNVQNLKVQLAGANGNHKEAMDQVNCSHDCCLLLLHLMLMFLLIKRVAKVFTKPLFIVANRCEV